MTKEVVASESQVEIVNKSQEKAKHKVWRVLREMTQLEFESKTKKVWFWRTYAVLMFLNLIPILFGLFFLVGVLFDIIRDVFSSVVDYLSTFFDLPTDSLDEVMNTHKMMYTCYCDPRVFLVYLLRKLSLPCLISTIWGNYRLYKKKKGVLWISACGGICFSIVFLLVLYLWLDS